MRAGLEMGEDRSRDVVMVDTLPSNGPLAEAGLGTEGSSSSPGPSG